MLDSKPEMCTLGIMPLVRETYFWDKVCLKRVSNIRKLYGIGTRFFYRVCDQCDKHRYPMNRNH